MVEDQKKNPVKTLITIVLSIGIAALFLWLALRGLEKDKILNSLKNANYFWVFAAMLFGLGAYWFRAIRWNLLLEPMNYKISNSNALWSLSFGYLMNLTIPRSGEVARATALYGVEKVPVENSFGTIILERIVDLLCMFLFLALALIFKFKAISSFYTFATAQKSSTSTSTSSTLYFILGAIIISVILLYFIFKSKIEAHSFYKKITNFGKGILTGLKSILHLKQKVKFIILSLAIWICYFFASYLVCFALPETANFTIADGFFIIVVGTLGMMVPASGGIGAFNYAMKLGFMALFLSMGKNPEAGGEIGLTYSFISLPLQILIMLVMGLISIPMLAKARKK
ncbi:lysylphosphatidylglycerol synthase transmembrane domain-containing protein [Halpernia frigidisoli]|uniref:Dolichol-P-glucose synthetase n=1 Tax=Halpernia frigidisoli TaxID=1125876 RepID=A0A1I3FR06_9FLAO|nr:lysylphosphatidylglycerol synthase transmembrane domain-containing protein [Halpernia frigidisoli]SFI13639.1 hypothetical protein SAMN05443292_1562 [Halpernia frigidisoli]